MLNGSEKMFSIADNYNAYLRKESREEIFSVKKFLCRKTNVFKLVLAIIK